MYDVIYSYHKSGRNRIRVDAKLFSNAGILIFFSAI